MPKLNRVLISSMVSQVEALDSLSKEISSWTDKEVDLSRKHSATATIDSETIETLKDYKGTAGEMYILLLELAYDRINFVMRLMIEFVEHRSGLESHERDYEETLTSLVRVEGHATVATTAKLLWRRLEAWPAAREINSRDAKRMAFFDEYKIAVGRQLAAMAESKIALEKTLVKTRKEIIDRRVTGNLAEPPRRSTSRATKGTQTSEAEMTPDEVTMGTKCAQCVSPLLLITPDDDPVMDMSREILSNEKKIDDLLRQNERLSRALVRISQYNNNNSNADIRPSC